MCNSCEMLIRSARATLHCGQGMAELVVRFLESFLPLGNVRISGARTIRSPGFPQGLLTPPVTCENGCKFQRHSVMGGRTLRMYNMNKGHSFNPFSLLPVQPSGSTRDSDTLARKNV